MTAKNFPNIGKVDMKLKAGILIILVLGIGIWWMMQPKTVSGPSTTTPTDSSASTSNIAPITDIKEATRQTATVAQDTQAAGGSIEDALDLLSS